MGMVLLDHPETTMQPLIGKFSRLQRDLDNARQQLAEHLTRERRPKHSIASFIGASTAAMEVKRRARRVAQTDSTVLLLGETGTGKELLAHAIHAASARAPSPSSASTSRPCPTPCWRPSSSASRPVPTRRRPQGDGKFKLAHGGTLFLDEIGDMPLPLRMAAARAAEQEVEPLSSNPVQHVDVRVIAATSRDLAAMVRAGTFRADLYYRLNVLPIGCRRCASAWPIWNRSPTRWPTTSRGAAACRTRACGRRAELLARQPWPGNIRELRNVLEQASLMTDDLVLGARHFAAVLGTPDAISAPLPAPPLTPAGSGRSARVAGVKSLPQAVAELEAQAIREALQPPAATSWRPRACSASRARRSTRSWPHESAALSGVRHSCCAGSVRQSCN